LANVGHTAPIKADQVTTVQEPAGWVAVEPRTHCVKLRTTRIPWSGRAEDTDYDGAWAVTCFVVRKRLRGAA
jgi:hypothetical protein